MASDEHGPTGEDPERNERSSQGIIEIIGATGAVFVVVLGLVCVFIVTLVAMGTLPGDQKAAVATAAFTVIGTIVGAYFGVRVGAAGKSRPRPLATPQGSRSRSWRPVRILGRSSRPSIRPRSGWQPRTREVWEPPAALSERSAA